MHIQPIDSLTPLRAALAADSPAVFCERVMAPIERFWLPFLQRFQRPDGAAPADYATQALQAAQAMGFYNPGDGSAAGLSALEAFDRAGVWPACVRAAEGALAALRPAEHGIALEPIQFTLLLGSLRILREQYGAYSGFQQPGMALVMGWPNVVGTPRLPVAAAHEINHIVRFAFEPWSMATTVGHYMVAEGLAEAFGLEVVGDRSLIGPYSNALSEQQRQALKPIFRAALDVTGFDTLRGYIFGDWAAEQFGYPKQGIPDYAGYTLGYDIVRAYLDRSGSSAADATYQHWRTIVDASGYFDD